MSMCRDRENSTVFVISPSAETEWTEDELKKFFKDVSHVALLIAGRS